MSDLVNFRDPDKVINHFLTNMRNEFLATLPENLATGLDKRKLIKNIKSMYRSKGSVRGHEMFFLEYYLVKHLKQFILENKC